MYIKHSKLKNTGILFEVLVKQITSDTLKGKNSPALDILKKYFINTELGKEYKLYETIFKSQNLTESKANIIINASIEASQKLNKSKIKNAKYSLIKELKEHYNVGDLFKTKLHNYKQQASLYVLFELYNSQNQTNPTQVIDNKLTLLEHLTKTPVQRDNVKKSVIEEFKSFDKDLRVLTYSIMLEKFNTKYNNFSSNQKRVLKEFIESVDSTQNLKNFYNGEIGKIQNILKTSIPNLKEKVTKIKLEEVSKLIIKLDNKKTISPTHLVDLLQYYSLVEEIKKVNG